MTYFELVLNMLAKATTTEISQKKQLVGLEQNRAIAKQGVTITGNMSKEIEKNWNIGSEYKKFKAT